MFTVKEVSFEKEGFTYEYSLDVTKHCMEQAEFRRVNWEVVRDTVAELFDDVVDEAESPSKIMLRNKTAKTSIVLVPTFKRNGSLIVYFITAIKDVARPRRNQHCHDCN